MTPDERQAPDPPRMCGRTIAKCGRQGGELVCRPSAPRDYTAFNYRGGSVTDKKKPPPREYSAFKKLLGKLAKVPKNEIEEKEAEYQRERKRIRKNA